MINVIILIVTLGTLLNCGIPEQKVERRRGKITGKTLGSNDAEPGTPNSSSKQHQDIPDKLECDEKISSCGSGGDLGLVEKEFIDSTGLPSNYRMKIPDDSSLEKSYGLLLYLHGDGGADYEWFFEDLVKIGAKYDLIPFAVKSPETSTWWQGADEKARFLDEIIQEGIFKKYNIDLKKIYLIGASGGQSFLTGAFLKHFAFYHSGGAVLLCGGMADSSLTFQDNNGEDKIFKLSFHIGENDYLLEQTKAAIQLYESKGFSINKDIIKGAEHCRFDLNEAIDRGLKFLTK